ncbi:MAG: hypothetical protein OXN22_03335 [Deltaproteobacteria bacterium]|nr:hypothetical protein [Deltaproteobacteria bacterium]
MRREPHITAEGMLARLGVKPGALGKVALVPGPRERAARLRLALEDPHKTLAFQDYEMHTGTLGGRRVTVGNGGRYSADTAITTELLCAAGVETLVRVGSCGSLQRGVKVGDVVIATGAVRGDGASPRYVPEDFDTVSHPHVLEALTRAAENLGVPVHHGRVFTTDALFRETPELVADLEAQGIAAIDMVTAAFLTVAQVKGAKAGAVLAVSDECVTGKLGFHGPPAREAEKRAMEIALKAVEVL